MYTIAGTYTLTKGALVGILDGLKRDKKEEKTVDSNEQNDLKPQIPAGEKAWHFFSKIIWTA